MKKVATVEIGSKIYKIRGKSVMFDCDLAFLYGVTTGNLNKAVKRNIDRFPDDFMFQLTKTEYDSLIFQFGISKGRGGTRHLPLAFTEQGVSMLSAILNSPTAIEISLKIIRAFVQLREIVFNNDALRYAVEGLEKRMSKNERDIQIAINAIQKLLPHPKKQGSKRKMGFV